MKELGVGIVGFGTVGKGAAGLILNNADYYAERGGIKPVLKGIADIDTKTDRGIPEARALLTSDYKKLIANDSIDVIIELTGTLDFAEQLCLEAFKAGKDVVTANKHLLAKRGKNIFKAAMESGRRIRFEGSVGGGIPIIGPLREGLESDKIRRIMGIVNGTCNYILTVMEQEGRDFNDVLKDAQDAGYAEADPTFDIEGHDSAHKISILSLLAFQTAVDFDSIYFEGIKNITIDDIISAANLGYKIKLLACAEATGDGIDIRVHPAMIPAESIMARVNGPDNAIMVVGEKMGTTMFFGPGAGGDATGAAVVGDVLALGQPARQATRGICGFEKIKDLTIIPITDTCHEYYLSLSCLDKPGSLADISNILKKHEISVELVYQLEKNPGNPVKVDIVLHETFEGQLLSAVSDINGLPQIVEETKWIRIEHLDK